MAVDLDELRHLACVAEDEGAWSRAAALYAKIAASADANFWDHHFRARAELYAGNASAAAELIAALPARKETRGFILMLDAEWHERQSDHKTALELWTEALYAGGSQYWCLFGRARALAKEGKIDEARTTMDQALGLPDREDQGLRFDARLREGSSSFAEGRLVEFDIHRNPKLGAISFEDLLGEVLARIREGESAGVSEARIAWAQELQERLADQLEVHDNRFSIHRLRDIFFAFYTAMKPPKPDLHGATILDIGSGAHNPLALSFLFLMLGARRAIAVDLDKIRDPVRSCRALARYADVMLTDPGRIVENFRISRMQIEENIASFDLIAMRQGRVEGIDSSRLRLVQESASHLSADSSSVDIVLTNSFLEHVPDPDTVLAEMARVTAPGGFGIHGIDGADHFIYDDPALHPLDFLRNEQPGMIGGCNRICPLEYASLFQKHGFAIQEIIREKTIEIDDTLRHSFAMPWRESPHEILEMVAGFLVVRRK